MLARTYILEDSISNIKANSNYYFGELWDGEGNGKELLESGVIYVEDTRVEFEVIELNEDDIMQSVVSVFSINF